MAHPVDAFVYRAFLLDIGVRPRDIGFGLVIIIIADEIFDRIVGEEALELAIELGRENLVGRKDQGRALQRFDHLGHGEGFAGPCYAEQHLILLAGQRALDQFGDRGALVARRFIIADQREAPPPLALFRPRRAVRHETGAGIGFVEGCADLNGHGGNMGALGRGAISLTVSVRTRLWVAADRRPACHQSGREGRFGGVPNRQHRH